MSQSFERAWEDRFGLGVDPHSHGGQEASAVKGQTHTGDLAVSGRGLESISTQEHRNTMEDPTVLYRALDIQAGATGR